jgi:hypothetical protein
MRFPLRITYLDGSAVEVVTSAADSVRFETRFDRSIVSISSDARYTDMIWLGWAALTRTKQTDLEFDAWIDTVDEVTVGEGSSDVPPLEKAAPTG